MRSAEATNPLLIAENRFEKNWDESELAPIFLRGPRGRPQFSISLRRALE
jgi:hypothetical protein